MVFMRIYRIQLLGISWLLDLTKVVNYSSMVAYRPFFSSKELEASEKIDSSTSSSRILGISSRDDSHSHGLYERYFDD